MRCFRCHARLCPLMPKRRLMHERWFSDEPVCLKGCRELKAPRWLRIQRIIWAMRPKPWGWFSIPMLESLRNVSPQVHGVQADDRWYRQAEKDWITRFGQRSPIWCRRNNITPQEEREYRAELEEYRRIQHLERSQA